MQKLNIKTLVVAAVASSFSLIPGITLAASSATLIPAEALRIGNYGGGNYLLQDFLSVYNNGGDNTQNSIIRFNLSSIPEYSIITSAQLALTASPDLGSIYSQQDGQYSDVFAVSSPWDINANWNDATSAVQWSTSGGDITGNAYATNDETIIPVGAVSVTWDITSLVSQWTSGALFNNGLMIKGSVGNQLHFYPINATDPSYVPKLSITYTIPEPSVPMLCVSMILGLVCRRNRDSSK